MRIAQWEEFIDLPKGTIFSMAYIKARNIIYVKKENILKEDGKAIGFYKKTLIPTENCHGEPVLRTFKHESAAKRFIIYDNQEIKLMLNALLEGL